MKGKKGDGGLVANLILTVVGWGKGRIQEGGLLAVMRRSAW